MQKTIEIIISEKKIKCESREIDFSLMTITANDLLHLLDYSVNDTYSLKQIDFDSLENKITDYIQPIYDLIAVLIDNINKLTMDATLIEKEENYKVFDSVKLKKVELIVSTIVGIIFLILLFFAITNEVFMPAALISFALFLFCICYYYIDDEKKKKFVYVLFSLGVLTIIIEVIYTIVKIN